MTFLKYSLDKVRFLNYSQAVAFTCFNASSYFFIVGKIIVKVGKSKAIPATGREGP
jgi:hypothetical protein